MSVINNYKYILGNLKLHQRKVDLIAVTKNQPLNKINLLIKENHFHFGENRVQEAILKWNDLINNYPQLKLHLIGKLQSNKAQEAFKIFHYIHTLDNDKLANIFATLEIKFLKKIKYFIQVNIANEPQKNGISVDKVNQFVKHCIEDLKLNIIGLMCIPPIEGNPNKYFSKLAELAKINNLNELSMGMSNDYECAIQNGATFIRIGSKIFNED
jgi:pyridoxal phosphate enzyme (YggS family)